MGIIYPSIRSLGIWPCFSIVVKRRANTGANDWAAWIICSAAKPNLSEAFPRLSFPMALMTSSVGDFFRWYKIFQLLPYAFHININHVLMHVVKCWVIFSSWQIFKVISPATTDGFFVCNQATIYHKLIAFRIGFPLFSDKTKKKKKNSWSSWSSAACMMVVYSSSLCLAAYILWRCRSSFLQRILWTVAGWFGLAAQPASLYLAYAVFDLLTAWAISRFQGLFLLGPDDLLGIFCFAACSIILCRLKIEASESCW